MLYNNLAHLHLQAAARSPDPAFRTEKQHQVIALLTQGLQLAKNQDSLAKSQDSLAESQDSLHYSFYKNQGWVRLLQDQPQVAQPLLESAIAISEKIGPNNVLNAGSAHCLLAQSLEAQNSPASLQSWQRCCQLGSSANANEDAWILEAQDKLKAENYDPNAVCKPNAAPVS